MAVRASDKVTLAVLPHPSYVRLYYVLQASALAAPAKPTVNPPVAPWVSVEPTYNPTSTDTLYTCMLTAYGSITFEYGTVQVSSSYEAAKAAYNLAFQGNATANGAATTAATKNTLVRSTSAASSPETYKVNDQWWQVAGTQIIAMWIHDGTYWLAQTLTSSVITNIDAGSITAGILAADRISGTAMDGETITGATVQTAASGARVKLDATGLKAYNASNAVKTTIDTNGVLTTVDAIISGSLRTAVSGKRIVVNAANNGIEFYGTGSTQSNPPTIYGDQNTGVGDSWLSRSGGNGNVDLEKYYLSGGGTSGVKITGGLRVDTLYDIAGNPYGNTRTYLDVQGPLYAEWAKSNAFQNLEGHRAAPFAMCAGRISGKTIAANAVTRTAITFPAGLFNVNPIVTITVENGARDIIAYFEAITWTGADLVLASVPGGSARGSVGATWTAVQMTPTSAPG